MLRIKYFFPVAIKLLLLFICFTPILAFGQGGNHQTPADTLAPLQNGEALPYRISVTEVDFGSADLPTLHSYSAAQYGGKWILIAGRTNGLHGFDVFKPEGNFPSQSQNRDVWVIDPVSKQVWHRTLDTSQGFSQFVVNALTPTNNQFYSRNDHLYMIGGYGVQSTDPDGSENFGTFDTLAAVNLPGIIDWVQNGTGSASDYIRVIQDPVLRVTGGAVHEINGRTHLVFGQDFEGVYNPANNGTYTRQVRSFNIVDDGTDLSITNITATAPVDEYRRRDLNVFPTLRPDGNGGHERGITVLSGFFTPPPGFGAWTVPVEIDENGVPDPTGLPDPDAKGTFRQGFNGYHSAKIGLFSESSGQMNEILFGGISLQEYDPVGDIINTDNFLPFINNIISVGVDADGNYSQFYLGDFPEVVDLDGNLLRFGANAEFFLADGLSIYDNEIVQFDEITEETTIGYVFGGLIANAPNTRNGPGISAASNMLFKVTLTPTDVATVVPDSFTVAIGRQVTGGVAELASSDDQYLVLDPTFLSFRYQLEYTVNAIAPMETPNKLEFAYESRTTNFVGKVVQKLELFNYDTAQFETISSGLTSPADTVVSVTPTGDPTRFIEPVTAAMQARISYQNSLPFWVFRMQNLYLPYRVRADHIFWTITP